MLELNTNSLRKWKIEGTLSHFFSWTDGTTQKKYFQISALQKSSPGPARPGPLPSLVDMILK